MPCGAMEQATQNLDQQLLEAAIGSETEEVTRLLLAGANVNATNDWCWTALHMAAWIGDPATVQLLFAAPGINVNAANSVGYTALFIAVQNHHTATVQALLAAPGIDVNAINEMRQSPLDFAIDAAIATLLRNHGGRTYAELFGPCSGC